MLEEDVDRIEVVASPSRALWGSNAVTGLIHVITCRAVAPAGPAERGAALRWGGALATGAGHWRACLNGDDRSTSLRSDGTPLNDAPDGAQTGFGADWMRLRH